MNKQKSKKKKKNIFITRSFCSCRASRIQQEVRVQVALREYGRTRCVICLNGSKNLWRIFWILKVFQNTGDGPASSSRESASEPGGKSGIGQAQYLNAIPEGPKLLNLPEDQNNMGFLQKTCWNSRASSGKNW